MHKRFIKNGPFVDTLESLVMHRGGGGTVAWNSGVGSNTSPQCTVLVSHPSPQYLHPQCIANPTSPITTQNE